MKLLRFTHENAMAIGRLDKERILNIGRAAPDLPKTLTGLLEGGAELLDQVRKLEANDDNTVALADVHLEAPVEPSKYLAIGMNYQAHADEVTSRGITIPDTQVWFNKQVSCINGPFDPVELPRVSEQLDYEVELGVVIGERCRHITEQDAPSVIAGYLVTNDVTIRDWQLNSFTWTIGKSFDTHGPIGPWLVTADEVPDPHALTMRLYVNGVKRQETVTNDMIHNIYQQIAYLSQVMTLEPGDLIATGTPSGAGVMSDPPRFLKVGDVVRAEIDGLGYIENKVVSES